MILHTDKFWAHSLTTSWILFFVDNPDRKFLLFRNLLGRVHSYSSPHFTWPSSWPDWRTLFVKLHTDTFLSAKFENDMSEFFVVNTDNFFSFSDSTGKHTLLFWPSFHLTKFMTRLKNTFRETAYRHFFERKIWQRHEYLFSWTTQIKNSFCFSF